MKASLVAILPRRSRTKAEPTDRLLAEYQERSNRYVPTESAVFDTEAEFLASLDKQSGRTAAVLILLDSRGQQLSSEEFASRLGSLRDSGAQRLILAVGPADGWSETARQRANLIVSFGRITLPHQLARVLAAEQLYRALTILAGHPYHSGH